VGGPGLAFETWVFRPGAFPRRNPGLKSETWATHLIIRPHHFHVLQRAAGPLSALPIITSMLFFGLHPQQLFG